MISLDSLPEGWEVWNREPGGRLILAYRPDVFDGHEFDAACLPTITVAPGTSPDQPPERRDRSDSWYVALFLEPAVRVRSLDAAFEDRGAAIADALDIAGRFSAGKIGYREWYQVPREAYLEALDGLVGAEDR